MKRKQLLKPGAVPTIFPKNTVAIGQRQSIRPRRTAYEKREHSRVIVCINFIRSISMQYRLYQMSAVLPVQTWNYRKMQLLNQISVLALQTQDYTKMSLTLKMNVIRIHRLKLTLEM